MPATSKPVLSLFPGAGLLDRAFEEAGFCVLRGPDILWSGDVRRFHCLPGFIGGVIGGPPCQDFSSLRRCEPSGEGLEMIQHFCRIIEESQAEWFLMENVPGVPSVLMPGYHVQRFNLAASECGGKQRRLRTIQFGNRLNNRPLVIPRPPAGSGESRAAVASEGRRAGRRSWPDFCELQGLPKGFALPGLTLSARYRAVGNGVPLQMGRVLARAVIAWSVTEGLQRVCVCDCGRPVPSGRTLATAACRKRMERRRQSDASSVTVHGPVTAGASQSLLEV